MLEESTIPGREVKSAAAAAAGPALLTKQQVEAVQRKAIERYPLATNVRLKEAKAGPNEPLHQQIHLEFTTLADATTFVEQSIDGDDMMPRLRLCTVEDWRHFACGVVSETQWPHRVMLDSAPGWVEALPQERATWPNTVWKLLQEHKVQADAVDVQLVTGRRTVRLRLHTADDVKKVMSLPSDVLKIWGIQFKAKKLTIEAEQKQQQAERGVLTSVSGNRCYICDAPGHMKSKCPRRGDTGIRIVKEKKFTAQAGRTLVAGLEKDFGTKVRSAFFGRKAGIDESSNLLHVFADERMTLGEVYLWCRRLAFGVVGVPIDITRHVVGDGCLACGAADHNRNQCITLKRVPERRRTEQLLAVTQCNSSEEVKRAQLDRKRNRPGAEAVARDLKTIREAMRGASPRLCTELTGAGCRYTTCKFRHPTRLKEITDVVSTLAVDRIIELLRDTALRDVVVQRLSFPEPHKVVASAPAGVGPEDKGEHGPASTALEWQAKADVKRNTEHPASSVKQTVLALNGTGDTPHGSRRTATPRIRPRDGGDRGGAVSPELSPGSPLHSSRNPFSELEQAEDEEDAAQKAADIATLGAARLQQAEADRLQRDRERERDRSSLTQRADDDKHEEDCESTDPNGVDDNGVAVSDNDGCGGSGGDGAGGGGGGGGGGGRLSGSSSATPPRRRLKRQQSTTPTTTSESGSPEVIPSLPKKLAQTVMTQPQPTGTAALVSPTTVNIHRTSSLSSLGINHPLPATPMTALRLTPQHRFAMRPQTPPKANASF